MPNTAKTALINAFANDITSDIKNDVCDDINDIKTFDTEPEKFDPSDE